MNYYIGIEATANRTVVLLADSDKQIVGRSTAGVSAYSIVGQERCAQTLWSAIIAAFSGAGMNTRDLLKAEMPLPDVEAICIGMSGIERPKDEGQIKRVLNEFNLTKNIQVTNEAAITLHAGAEAGWGVAVLAGDNSLAFAQNAVGQTAKAGGGGYLLGDEGSAHWLGLMAVKAVLAAADGRAPQTALTEALELEWKVQPGRTDVMIAKLYSLLAGLGSGGNKAQLEETTENYKRQLALLAPHVERLAGKRDEAADLILGQAATELSKAARAACNRVGLDGSSPETAMPMAKSAKDALLLFQFSGKVGGKSAAEVAPMGKIPLVLSGSVLLSNKGELRQRLTALLPEYDVPVLVTEAAEGALKLAMSL